jgi:ABC-type branched-subunit amino acid transport system substrate-binding protein
MTIRLITLSLWILTFFSSTFADSHLKIASLLPLTGELAETGAEIKNGMLLAQKELGDKSPQLIFEDTGFDLKTTATVTQKVISLDHPDVIISLWDEADVVAPLTEKAGIVHIAIRWDPHVTKNRPLTFTVECTYQSWVTGLISLLQKYHLKTTTFIGQENSSTNQVLKELENRKVTILRKDLLIGSSADIKSLIPAHTKLKPDVILLFAFPPMIDQFVKQIQQVAPKQKFTGMLEVVTDPHTIEGIPNVITFFINEEFSTLYKAQYGTLPKIRAPHGYEIVKIISDIETSVSQKMTSQKLAEKISEIKNRPSSLGLLSITGERNIEHPVHLGIVVDGKKILATEELLKESKWGTGFVEYSHNQ